MSIYLQGNRMLVRPGTEVGRARDVMLLRFSHIPSIHPDVKSVKWQ